MSLINLKACAAGDFEIASMLTCAAEQVLGRKGVLEVISQNQNLSSPKYLLNLIVNGGHVKFV